MLQVSARGYVCHLASDLGSLTVLSSSLYTQNYSLCCSTHDPVPKWDRSNGQSLKGKCEPH